MIRMLVLIAMMMLSGKSLAAGFSMVKNPPEMPGFSLTDHRGQSFSNEDLKGHWTLVLVGFTSCPDVCPYTLGNLEHVLAEASSKISPDNLPKVVFLAVDPARDKASLAGYVNHFHPDFIGVTGEVGDVDAFVEGLDAFYKLKKPNAAGFYDVSHSADIRVLDPTGVLHATIETPMNAPIISDFLLKLQIDFWRGLQ